jgi:uncharacterized repeat protein (TIGR01451 family)
LLAFSLVAVGAGGTAYAAGALDQSATCVAPSINEAGGTVVLGQTFTAGLSGTLDQVDLDLSFENVTDPGNLTVQIRTTSGGQPTSTVLASATVAESSVSPTTPTFLSVPLSPGAPSVAGTVYAIVLLAPAGNANRASGYDWQEASGYSRGGEWDSTDGGRTFFLQGGGGFAFRTHVTGTTTPQADLSVSKVDNDGGSSITAHQGSATPGTSITWTIVATNNGPADTSGVTIADTFPVAVTNPSWTAAANGGACGFSASGTGNIDDTSVSMPNGSSVTYTITAPISPSATGTLANTATVSGPTSDPITANNTATDTDTLSPHADLSVKKTDNAGGTYSAATNNSTGGTVANGQPLTYTILVANAGPSDATGATVTDTFPSGFASPTWAVVGSSGGASATTTSGSGSISDSVTLPAGSSITFQATGTATGAGTLTNTATVSPPGGVVDGTPANNTSTDTVTVNPVAHLSVTKSGPSSSPPGSNIPYTVTLTNNGPDAATNASLSDLLPSGTSFVSASTISSGWTCGAVGNQVTCSNASFPASSSATFSIVTHVPPTASGSVSNTATASASDASTAPSNTVTTAVHCQNTLSGNQASVPYLSGGSWCLSGVTTNGSVNAAAGTTVVITNSSIGGGITASSPNSVSVCGSTVNGSVYISGASGFVLLGDPGDDNCAGNSFGSGVTLSNNHAGVEVSHNSKIGGTLTLSANSGSALFDDAHPEVEANTIYGNLNCYNDTPAAINDGQHNTVSGARNGECSTA